MTTDAHKEGIYIYIYIYIYTPTACQHHALAALPRERDQLLSV